MAATFTPRLQHLSQLKGVGATLPHPYLSSCRQSEETDSYDTRKKGTEGHANACKDVLCSGVKESTTLKCAILAQSNLQLQCNLYENSNGIFHRERANNLKTCMVPQKNLNSQSNFEKGEQDLKHHTH